MLSDENIYFGNMTHRAMFYLQNQSVYSFTGLVPSSATTEPIHVQIMRCDPHDASKRQCLDLAAQCCLTTIQAIDVVRGRLDLKVLSKTATSLVVRRIENLCTLLDSCNQTDTRYEMYIGNLPIRSANIHGVLLNPFTFEASLGIHIGSAKYWANIVLNTLGSQWMCTELQLG
jgi:hypothetical protein